MYTILVCQSILKTHRTDFINKERFENNSPGFISYEIGEGSWNGVSIFSPSVPTLSDPVVLLHYVLET